MKTIKTLNKRRKKKLRQMFKEKEQKRINKQKIREEKYKYNPPPCRTLETQKEINAFIDLKKKEKERKSIKNTKFTVWEYRDRYKY